RSIRSENYGRKTWSGEHRLDEKPLPDGRRPNRGGFRVRPIAAALGAFQRLLGGAAFHGATWPPTGPHAAGWHVAHVSSCAGRYAPLAQTKSVVGSPLFHDGRSLPSSS